MNKPVLFIIFNRPDTTKEVFAAIKKAKPPKLYISADGPRKNVEKDKIKCLQARDIVNQVDWDCKVYKLFHKNNLGCGIAPVTAINWFFNNETEGIILEDDCLPVESFFNFCSDLLNFYKNDKKVMLISGNNYQFGRTRGEGSYYFSRIPHTWGWATWKRAWQKNDFQMRSYVDFKKNNGMKKVFSDINMQHYWYSCFNSVAGGSDDIWDYQWFYSIMKNDGICITPNNNLVSNIGHGDNATHTIGKTVIASVNKKEIIKIIHPKISEINEEADKYFFYKVLKPTLFNKIINALQILINMFLLRK